MLQPCVLHYHRVSLSLEGVVLDHLRAIQQPAKVVHHTSPSDLGRGPEHHGQRQCFRHHTDLRPVGEIVHGLHGRINMTTGPGHQSAMDRYQHANTRTSTPNMVAYYKSCNPQSHTLKCSLQPGERERERLSNPAAAGMHSASARLNGRIWNLSG